MKRFAADAATLCRAVGRSHKLGEGQTALMPQLAAGSTPGTGAGKVTSDSAEGPRVT